MAALTAALPPISSRFLARTLRFLSTPNLPAKNHATPPARTIAAAVSKPIPPSVVVDTVVVAVIDCLRPAYWVKVSSSNVPVAISPFSVTVISDVVIPFAPRPSLLPVKN